MATYFGSGAASLLSNVTQKLRDAGKVLALSSGASASRYSMADIVSGSGTHPATVVLFVRRMG